MTKLITQAKYCTLLCHLYCKRLGVWSVSRMAPFISINTKLFSIGNRTWNHHHVAYSHKNIVNLLDGFQSTKQLAPTGPKRRARPSSWRPLVPPRCYHIAGLKKGACERPSRSVELLPDNLVLWKIKETCIIWCNFIQPVYILFS